jgi:hypothetical protein
MDILFKRPDIHVLQVGDTVRMTISFQSGRKLMEGKVVYIHPKLRFFTVEFSGEDYRIKESYCANGPAD